jgi:hypothetical protein
MGDPTKTAISVLLGASIPGMVLPLHHQQSWALEAMKRCDEALNASSLQFLCQR